jgi:hypothetical protein
MHLKARDTGVPCSLEARIETPMQTRLRHLSEMGCSAPASANRMAKYPNLKVIMTLNRVYHPIRAVQCVQIVNDSR